jgi:uncharacterized iron-regulated membrane protein
MKPTLRQSMDYLHTWAGVLFSALLFLVFFMGTLSVFDREIDRWMMPATRVAMPPEVSFDRMARPHLEKLAPTSSQWYALYPTEREPVMRIGWREGKEFKTRHVDANSGQLLPEVGSKGGTGFFFPFHYSFHLKSMDIGYWLLAIVGITMMVLLVSGVIIHRKIFADFFTFRPHRSMQRATLDLHNASSVLLLPFHFVITVSGLIIFIFIYMKPGIAMVYGKDVPKAVQEIQGRATRPPAKQPGELASVDAMVREAQVRWGGGPVRNVNIVNPRDRHVVVDVLRRPHDRISYDTHTVVFDGTTGAVLSQQKVSPAMQVQKFFSGLHMIPFDHWGLRWLYFVMGLISCVMIATGFLLWVEKRRARHEKDGKAGYRVVNAVAVAATLGVVTATLMMLVANKLLPVGLPQRELVEQWMFFAAWIGVLAHAVARAFFQHSSTDLRIAWREQAWIIAALAVLAAMLNGVLTGDHLFMTLAQSNFALAGTDLVLLASAALAVLAARRLSSGGTIAGAQAEARGAAI